MYNCDDCGAPTKPGQSMLRFVAEKRPKTYRNLVVRGKRKECVESLGWEIAGELKLCPPCYNKRLVDERAADAVEQFA